MIIDEKSLVVNVELLSSSYKISVYEDKNANGGILRGYYMIDFVFPSMLDRLFPILLEKKIIRTARRLKRDIIKHEKDQQWLRELNQRLNASLEEM